MMLLQAASGDHGAWCTVHLWLGVAQSSEQCVDLLHAEGEVGVRVKAENFRRVDLRERLDVLLEGAKLLRAVDNVEQRREIVENVLTRRSQFKR